MEQVYNWETNTIDISDKYKNRFNLQLRGDKNIVKGSSGTGKTFLCNHINKIKNSFNTGNIPNVDNIILLNKENKGNLSTYINKLIIVDSADLLLSDEDIDVINRDCNNRYLLFSREPLGIEISPNHQADLITNGNLTTLQYRFNVKGWC